MPLLKAIIFSCLWVFGHGHLEQPEISVSRAMDQSAQISCKVSLQDLSKIDIHWYRQKPNQHLEYLIYVRTNYNQKSLEGKDKKIEVSKNLENSISTLQVNFLKKEDEAIYYCAFWSKSYNSGWIKEFAGGTKLIVIPSDKSFDGDISPKPTIFLPSVAETNRHKAGTYLCLLEKFFPDVIKVNWKEKGSSKILQSLEGNPMKTNDTYMKVSWLTVPEESMDKEYRCIVKHEKNKGGVDQEILFPPANKVATTVNPTEAYLKTETAATTVDSNSRKIYLRREHDVFQLQLTSTCAYYTYLLLLLKSIIYFTTIAFCLFRRTSVCDDEKSS